MDFNSQLLLPENFYWAWEKAKKMYMHFDAWHNELELAKFEGNLSNNLHSIEKDFSLKTYTTKPIIPMAHPKKVDADGNKQLRQYFDISIRDQVAWIAYINVVGPWIDRIMPAWSYGHRLFRSVWFDQEQEGSHLKFGNYRHSSGQLYRKFQQSWPIYRRHIYLTIKAMTKGKKPWSEINDLDPEESQILTTEKKLSENYKLGYLKDGYWPGGVKELYWASIDLKKFYPNINLKVISKNITDNLKGKLPPDMGLLLDGLLNFKIKHVEYTEPELIEIGLSKRHDQFFGLPTGLFVSGFLANIAMLSVDQIIMEKLESKKIAHFRFVDDHVFIASDFNELLTWIQEYKNILALENIGAEINLEKTEPEELGKVLNNISSGCGIDINNLNNAMDAASKKTRLDPFFPSPLMTKTLAVVSNIAKTKFDLLHPTEQDHLFNDLEHLLVTDFPNAEIREGTRISFAASMISRFAPRRLYPSIETANAAKILSSFKTIYKNSCERKEIDIEKKNELNIKIETLQLKYKKCEDDDNRRIDKEIYRISSLLSKAIRDHPEKLRLWEKTLKFCANTGHELTFIENELNKIRSECKLTAAYIAAYIHLIIARQMFISVKTMVSEERSIIQKKFAESYILNAIKFLNSTKDTCCYYYEKISFNLAQCAFCSVLVIVNGSPGMFSQSFALKIQGLVEQLGLNLYCTEPYQWVDATSYQLSTWHWWIESLASGPLSTVPSPTWYYFINVVEDIDATSWSLISKYPYNIPEKLVPKIEEVILSRKNKSAVDYGWIYDFIKSRPKNSSIYTKNKHPPKINYVLKSLCKDVDFVTLDDWLVSFQNDNNRSIFDPRYSEWTYLEIIRQICGILSSFETISNRKTALTHIHPSNYKIPKAWGCSGGQLNSWEAWRNIAHSHKIVLRKDNLIHDERLTPSWIKGHLKDTEWAPVRGLGMLLLGMVCGTFRWPSSWNPRGFQRAQSYLAKQYIRSCPVSSWTSAILSSCLLPRSRETFLLSPIFNEMKNDDDTTIDPPPISNIGDLSRFVTKAQNVLVKYQVAVSNHQPRQLIPVKLSQMTRDNWNKELTDD